MSDARTSDDCPDVTVTQDNPLNVTDDYRCFGTVTIQSGGQIHIQTTAQVTIETLVKE